jgi:hypothetical protein
MRGMESGRVIHIGRTDFRNDDRLFGIKHEDRFSHLYIIGKTGTGKSTLLETMALQDLQCGNGFALIDPHGDLVSRIAARIPASQRDRVIYLNTTDPAQPYGYNPLRHVAEDRIALAASGMIEVWPAPGLDDARLSESSVTLELHRGQVTDRRVPAFRIVEALDIVKHIRLCFIARAVGFVAGALGLQRREEALHNLTSLVVVVVEVANHARIYRHPRVRIAHR